MNTVQCSKIQDVAFAFLTCHAQVEVILVRCVLTEWKHSDMFRREMKSCRASGRQDEMGFVYSTLTTVDVATGLKMQ